MKIGRPEKLEEERLSVCLPFRVTISEGDRIFKQATAEGVSVSTLLRRKLREVLTNEASS